MKREGRFRKIGNFVSKLEARLADVEMECQKRSDGRKKLESTHE
jgi:hypothetical protein